MAAPVKSKSPTSTSPPPAALAPRSTGELITVLNALKVLGPVERVTERRLERLLAARPDLEPPRISGRRMFGPLHEGAIRAAFEARREAKARAQGARARPA